MKHLGVHPWDVLSVAMTQLFGLTVGIWTIIIGTVLIIVALILDRSYIRAGTFFNLIAVGSLVDFYLWLDFFPPITHTWTDVLVMVFGIFLMGFGGGTYNAMRIGSGPRDGFMLSISDKTGFSISRVRILTETTALIIGFLLGGPVFIFTFLFTLIQSPIFQFTYLRVGKILVSFENRFAQEQIQKPL